MRDLSASSQGSAHSEPCVPLLQGFVLCGMPSVTKWHGLRQRYQPVVLDSLFSQDRPGGASQLPAQFALCCLPDGVHITASGDQHKEPKAYSIVLTGADGSRLYVSCLSYYQELPASIVCQHPGTVGARASQAMCLVASSPYLATMEALLRRLYTATFITGTVVPVADLAAHMLAIPCPGMGGLAGVGKVCFEVEGHAMHVLAPEPLHGIPLAELPVKPLLESLSPDNLILVFLAVLLERRVLLRSRQYRLLTLAGEALRQLLYPLKHLHTYIPAMPACLCDYLDAPTPFLMGLHSGIDVDQSVLAGLLVADLDRDHVDVPEGDEQLTQLLTQPCLVALRTRLCHLLSPASAPGDRLLADQLLAGRLAGLDSAGAAARPWDATAHVVRAAAAAAVTGAAAPDPWIKQSQQLAYQGWGSAHEQLVRRLFLTCMSDLLVDYHRFLPKTSSHPPAAGQGRTEQQQQQRVVSGSLGSSGFVMDMVLAIESGGRPAGGLLRRQSASSHSITNTRQNSNGGPGLGFVTRRESSGSNGLLPLLRTASSRSVAFNASGFVAHREKLCKSTGAMLTAVTQTLGFFAFVEEQQARPAGGAAAQPYAWLHQAVQVLSGGHHHQGGHHLQQHQQQRVAVMAACRPGLLEHLRPTPYRTMPPLNLLEKGLQVGCVPPAGPCRSAAGSAHQRVTRLRRTQSLGASSDWSASSQAVTSSAGGYSNAAGETSTPPHVSAAGMPAGAGPAPACAPSPAQQPGPMEAAAQLAGLRYHRSSTSCDSISSASLCATPGHTPTHHPLAASTTTTTTTPGGPAASSSVPLPPLPSPAPHQPHTSLFRLSAPWKPKSQPDVRTVAPIKQQQQQAQEPAAQAAVPLVGVQLEADLARRQGRALRALLKAADAGQPLPAGVAAASKGLMRLHLGSSTWLLVARLRDELGRAANTTSAAADTTSAQVDSNNPTTTSSSRGVAGAAQAPSGGAAVSASKQALPAMSSAATPWPVAERHLESERFSMMVELLAGGVDSAVAWRDWRVLSGLLSAASCIVLLQTGTGLAHKERALHALGEVQPLLHNAAVWTGVIKAMLVDAASAPPPEPLDANPTPDATAELDSQGTATMQPLLPDRAVSALLQCAGYMIGVGLGEEASWALLTHAVNTYCHQRRRAPDGPAMQRMAAQLLAIRGSMRIAACAREQAVRTTRLRLPTPAWPGRPAYQPVWVTMPAQVVPHAPGQATFLDAASVDGSPSRAPSIQHSPRKWNASPLAHGPESSPCLVNGQAPADVTERSEGGAWSVAASSVAGSSSQRRGPRPCWQDLTPGSQRRLDLNRSLGTGRKPSMVVHSPGAAAAGAAGGWEEGAGGTTPTLRSQVGTPCASAGGSALEGMAPRVLIQLTQGGAGPGGDAQDVHGSGDQACSDLGSPIRSSRTTKQQHHHGHSPMKHTTAASNHAQAAWDVSHADNSNSNQDRGGSPAARTARRAAERERLLVRLGSDGSGGCVGALPLGGSGGGSPTPVTALAAAGGVCVVGSLDASLTAVRWQGGTGGAAALRIPLPGVRGGCSGLAVAQDAALCVAAGRLDHGLVLADVGQGRALARLAPGHTRRVTQLILSPSSSLLLSASADDYARLWDLRKPPGGSVSTNAVVGVCAHQGGVECVMLDSTAMQVSTGGQDGTVKVWDLRRTSQPLACLAGHTGPITQLITIPSAPSSDGGAWPHVLASCSADWTVRLWELTPGAHALAEPTMPQSNGGTCRAVLVGHGGAVHAACCVPAQGAGHQQLATAAADGSLAVWDVAAAMDTPASGCIALRRVHDGPINLLCAVPTSSNLATTQSGAADSPLASMLFTGGQDGVGCMWQLAAPATRQFCSSSSGGWDDLPAKQPAPHPASEGGMPAADPATAAQLQPARSGHGHEIGFSTGLARQSREPLVAGARVALGGSSSVTVCDASTCTVFSGSASGHTIHMWQPCFNTAGS